ncbi:MAG TPA: chloride channel protein, partial [Rikenellaceae bacterium]|nr:chloride channel protein [Rikenellaceae bacterium]
DQAVLTLMKTSDVIESDFLTVNPHDSLEQLVRVVQESNRNLFPVTDTEGCLQGIVSLDDMRSIMFRRELYGK